MNIQLLLVEYALSHDAQKTVVFEESGSFIKYEWQIFTIIFSEENTELIIDDIHIAIVSFSEFLEIINHVCDDTVSPMLNDVEW
jgi:hypothetical protein